MTSSAWRQGKLNDSGAAALDDGYQVTEIAGTIEEAARPETAVPVTFGT
jgi:hypothetical protein